jgi:hypothetical protein
VARVDPPLPDAPLVPGWANRTALLVGLVAMVQVAFIWSYVAALHQPDPDGVPFGVVAPAEVFTMLQREVGSATSTVDLVAVADADTARAQVTDGTLPGAVVVGGTGPTTDLLIVTEVPSLAYENLFRDVLDHLDAQLAGSDPSSARSYAVTTVNPFASGDPEGLTPFYLAIGWVVGGYLLLAFLGFTQRHADGWEGMGRRILLLVGYAIVSGAGGALVVGPLLGIFDDHLLQLAVFGAALSLAVTTTVQAMEVLGGPVYGIGLAIVAYVVVGNPAAGGPFPRSFLPGFWDAVGGWLPPGMGVDGIRAIEYDTAGLAAATGRIVAYVAVGLAVCLTTVAVTERRARRARRARQARQGRTLAGARPGSAGRVPATSNV